MANRRDIEAGRAFVTIFAKTSPLMKELKSIEGYFSTWGGAIMKIGAGITFIGTAITGVFVAAVAAFNSMGSELDDMSKRTGVSASKLAELKYAADQSATSIEAVEAALIAMSKRGFDPRRFDEYAEQIAALPAGLRQIQRAVDIFGKGGAELIPMLLELKELRKEARDLGIVPTEDAVRQASLLGDLWDKLWSVMRAAAFEVGAAIAPVLIPVLKDVIQIAAGVTRWIRENQELVRIIAAVGAGLIVVGWIVTAIGAGLAAIASLLGAIGAAAAGIAVIATPAGALTAGIAVLILGVAAVGVAIAAAAGYWLLFTRQGQHAARMIMIAFAPVLFFLKKVFRGIFDAIAGGDFGLAAEIAAASMKVAFFEAIDEIVDYMLRIPAQFLAVMTIMANFDGSGLTARYVTKGYAALAEMDAASNSLSKSAELDLERLLLKARRSREEAGNEGQYGDSMGGMDFLKSIGSFNPYALTMQNWASGGAKNKQEDLLQKIYDSNMKGHEATKRAVESTHLEYAT